jgi:hypothetical protein
MIKKYSAFLESFKTLINEFNQQDKEVIRRLDDYFTIAIEYEICSKEDPEEEPAPDEEPAIENAIAQTMLDLKRGKTLGAYGFAEVKWDETKFRENEKSMLDNTPNFDSLTNKKKKTLHKEYKTWTWFQSFLDELTSLIDFDDQIETAENLDEDNFDDDLEKIIANRFSYNIQLFGFMQNIEYLKEKAEEHLPNFWKNWSHTFKYELEGDVDKQRILELSPKTYVKGISQGIKQLEDFYNDFENQDYWYFNNRTALHINVGVTSKVRWNPIKGLLLMGDYGREEKEQMGKTPYVFKGIEWRYGNRFTGSLIDAIKKNLKGEMMYQYSDIESKEVKTGDIERDKVQAQIDAMYDEIKSLKAEMSTKSKIDKKAVKQQIAEIEDKIAKTKPVIWNLDIRNREEIAKHPESLKQHKDLLDLKDVKAFEDYFNEFLIKANKDFYIKEFGIKLTEIDKNYVEFRYVGTTIADNLGGVDKQMMIDKMYYFCYIVYLMTNDDYKKREYYKKLFKLTDEIKTYIK